MITLLKRHFTMNYHKKCGSKMQIALVLPKIGRPRAFFSPVFVGLLHSRKQWLRPAAVNAAYAQQHP